MKFWFLPRSWIHVSAFADVAGFKFGAYRIKERVRSDAEPPPTNQRPKYLVTTATLKLAQLVGMPEIKTRLFNAGRLIRDSVTLPNKKDKKKQAIHGPAKVRNGILLHGAPGNGKTMFAEALAGELGLPFLRATYGDLASKWVNETTENVTQLFRDAKAQAPCVLFIDEIDALLVKRDKSLNSDSESAKTVNALLTEMVDIRKHPVVLIAATNYLDQLDPAAIREGRFDFKIEITPPDQEAREAIITSTLKRNNVTTRVEPDTLKTVAARWKGYSSSRIVAIIDELSTQLPGHEIAVIELSDFMDALRNVQGRKGNLPEGTQSLDKLHFPESVAKQLKGIANRMIHIEEVEALGGTVPAGLLFWGPPGTGKTATARALAKTTGWAFLSVSGNELLSTSSRIDDILKEAAELRPCIVFIDEADDVLAERGGNAYATTVTNKLLTAIDGASGKVPDVVFIAATNLPETMDAAALRGGRFTEKIEFSLPDAATIARFVAEWKQTTKAKVAADVTPEAVGNFLEGQSIANVQEILQQGINMMITRKMTGESDAMLKLEDVRQAAASVGQFQ